MEDTPSSSSFIVAYFTQSVSALENSILIELAAQRISGAELESRYPGERYAAGWQFVRRIGERNVQLHLLLPHEFPFAPPSFAFASAPPILTYPHVETNGVLCLLSSSASVDSSKPVEVVKELLLDVDDLLVRSFAGTNEKDFQTEFLSYWSKSGTDSKRFVGVLRSEGPSRMIKVWNSTSHSFFAENDDELLPWVQHRNPDLKKINTFPAAVLWLERALLPGQYPNTSSKLLQIVRKVGDDRALSVLQTMIAAAPKRLEVLLATRSDAGTFYAGLTLYRPDSSANPHSKVESPLTRGFRPNKVPSAILADRYLNATQPIKRHDAERADYDWIHGRDAGQDVLRHKHVAILGCGSVGSPAAKLLATTGVGKLTLIDPEFLTWANIGRHHLGARYIGGNKATFLAEELKENYPHLEFDAQSIGWEAVAKQFPGTLENADLIVSTIGSWTPEALLNRWQRDNSAPPVIYGWTEAFASAGHAVAIFNKGACFQCQLNEHGEPVLTVTAWGGSTLRQEAACGVMFQPYGPIEVSYTCSIVAEHAVDVLLGKIDRPVEKIWAARESLVRENGGDWTTAWLAETGGNTVGGLMVERRWDARADCPVCGNAMAAC